MTSVEQIRAELIRAARGIGAPEDIEPLLERPRESSHGDWATNVAMVLVPATIVFAWLFFWFCEKPFMVRRAPATSPEKLAAWTAQPSTAGD